MAGVSQDEELWVGTCMVAGGLSGLFIVREAWLVALGTGVLLQSRASECEVESVSGCATGGAVEVLALSRLIKSTG